MELTEAMRTTGTCRYFRPRSRARRRAARGVRRRPLRPAGRQPAAGALGRRAGRRHQAGARRPLPAAVEGLPRRDRHRRGQRRRAAPRACRTPTTSPSTSRPCRRSSSRARSSPGCTPPTRSWGASRSSAARRSTRPCRTSCLALRDQGVGSAVTTLLCTAEPQVRELLAIPDGFVTAVPRRGRLPGEAVPAQARRDRPSRRSSSPSRSAPRCSRSTRRCAPPPRRRSGGRRSATSCAATRAPSRARSRSSPTRPTGPSSPTPSSTSWPTGGRTCSRRRRGPG